MTQRSVLFPLVVAFAAACSPATALEVSSETKVAKVAGITLTESDLEAFLVDQLAQIDQQRRQILEQGVGPLIEKTLLELEAKNRKVPLEELVPFEPVSDDAAEAWYEENKARLQGSATKEELLPQVKLYLAQTNAEAKKSELLADLRQKYAVEIFFEPARVQLAEDGATTKGPRAAPVTIVEFSDFQCPACRGFNPVLTEVLGRYGDQVRLVFRQLPLSSIHPQAQKAAEASLCARDQDQFWAMHDAMFANQRNLSTAGLKEAARTAGLDGEAFDQCLDSDQHASAVQADVDLATKLGLNGTPSVFVNGRVVAPGRVPSVEQLVAIIDEELLRNTSNTKK